LFGSELCPFTSRIWIALQCKGFDVRVVWLTSDDDARGNKLDLLASIRPDVKLPILQYRSDTIFGSTDVILQYIETKFPNPHLVPDGPMADITLDWVAYIRDIFSPSVE
jgi:glutathione S-transferase